MNKYFLIAILILSHNLFAKEVVWLGRSPRGLLMGDAWTTLAVHDEMSLFYNPASLGGNKTIGFNIINPRAGVTNALDELDRFEDFPSGDAAAIADRILGFPVYIEASAFPTIKMLNFQFSLFATSKTSMILRNKVHPSLEVDYRYDRGFVTGFGYNILGNAKGNRLSLGYSLKYIRREGLNSKFDLFGTGLLDDITNGVEDTEGLRDALGFAEGKGFGHDIGLEHVIGNERTKITTGFSILNVTDMNFRKTGGTQAVPRQDMYMNLGTSFSQDLGLIDYALAMDIKPINSSISFARKINIGAKVSFPIVGVYAGWSGGYLSYGAEFNLWPVNILAGFYSVEIGNEFKEQEGKRAFIYLSLLDIEIDAF